jgi:xanthine dehydrogenase/oxidase
MYTGKRHEAEVDGTLYFNKKTNKFVFLDVQGFLEGGYSTDLSPAVLERFVYHLDNAYKFESARFVGQVCRTNSRSNTAFRGFGAPQAILFIETMLQSFCTQNKLCLNDVRLNNFY